MVLLKSQISNFYFCLCFLMYSIRISMPIFTKNINIWAHWNFFKWKLWFVCAGACTLELKFWNWTLKSYLTFGYLTCSVRKKKKIPHSTQMYSSPSARLLKFWICTSKIIPDLWLVDLFWPIKKNFHTPPYCTLYFRQFESGSEPFYTVTLWLW